MSSILSSFIIRCPLDDVSMTSARCGFTYAGKYLEINGFTFGFRKDPSEGAPYSNLTPMKS